MAEIASKLGSMEDKTQNSKAQRDEVLQVSLYWICIKPFYLKSPFP